MFYHHARFIAETLLHLAAELAVHFRWPALAKYTLPVTLFWLLRNTWRHVRAIMQMEASTQDALPPAQLPPDSAAGA